MGPLELWITVIAAIIAIVFASWTAYTWSAWRKNVIRFLTEIRDLLRKSEE